MSMTLGALNEAPHGEARVALTPEIAAKWIDRGWTVLVERGAGDRAGITDEDFADTGASVTDRSDVLSKSSLLLVVTPPDSGLVGELPKEISIAGYMAPYGDLDRFTALAKKHINSFSVELIPRITRAQSMDALSSQAGVAGYKAVLIAANLSGRFLPMLTTAAGTIRPSKVLIIGAGVAGLQAIATARRLGAIVEGFDVRPETREQIESLGARFLDLGVHAVGEGGYARELTAEEKAQQQHALGEHLAKVDVVVTTAAVPGRPAPRILTTHMTENMKPGSVVVDLGAESGGNCELTRANETIVHNGIIIHGPINLPAMLPVHASQMYARNLWHFLSPMVNDQGHFEPYFDDEVVAASCVTYRGEVHSERVKEALKQGAGQ